MKDSSLNRGVMLALAAGIVSGISIYVNKFAVQAMNDALLFTTLKNTLVGIAFVALLATIIVKARPVRSSGEAVCIPQNMLGLVLLAVIGGSVPFLLFFQGLALASGSSAALIQKSLFLWVALLAAPLLGERLGRATFLGLGLLAIGQLLAGWPAAWAWGRGESLILVATLLWAGETIVAKRLMSSVSAQVAASARMAGGALVMWLYLLVTGQAGNVLSLTSAQWGWVVLTSGLLLAYVSTWYAALKLAPASVVSSILVLGAVITAGLSLVMEGTVLQAPQWLGLTLVLGGSMLIASIKMGGGRHVRTAGA
jgi:drug/metabolite transporter (DMT)-like permease